MLDISVALFAKNNRFKCYADGIRRNVEFFGSNNTRVYVDDFALNEELGQKKIYFSTNDKLLWTAYKIINYEVGVLNIDADVIITEKEAIKITNNIKQIITKNKNKKILITSGSFSEVSDYRKSVCEKLCSHFMLPFEPVYNIFSFFYTNSQEFLSAYKRLPLDIDYYYRTFFRKQTPPLENRDFNFETTVATVREEDIGTAIAKKTNTHIVHLQHQYVHDRSFDNDEAFMRKDISFTENNFTKHVYTNTKKIMTPYVDVAENPVICT